MLGNMAYAQEKKDAPQTQDVLPYLKYPKLPAFNIMQLDSSTIFNTFNIPKGKPVALVFFDPDCSHCRTFTERLTNGMDSVKNVRFYMVTVNHDFEQLRGFYKKYELAKYKNIELVGRDYEFFFMSYYGPKTLPIVVVYDSNKQLVTLLDNIRSVADLYAVTSKLK
jgi:thiol-disulfide isomerase/thioredoxin